MSKRARSSLPKPPQKNGHLPESDYIHEEPIPVIRMEGVADPREGLGKKRHRETADLRALLAETVLEYTTLKRRDDISRGVDPRKAQEIVEEYDPIVMMAVIGVRSDVAVQISLSANAEVAQYIRPKLKSVEVISDPEKAEDAKKRSEKAAALLAMIDQMALGRRQTYESKRAEEGVLLDRPDGSKS